MKHTLFFIFVLISISAKAQYTSIPDINFEKALISLGIDNGVPDGKVLTSSISNISTLSIGARNISDLTGIEDFINLTELNCQANNLPTLDLSKNLKLENLDCYTNQLTNLNVTKNLNLKTINCQENKLTFLDVSSNTSLTYLDSDNNYITNIDLSKNTFLQILQLNFNLIENLDVSKNINLMNLQCVENQLKTLDLSKNPDLYLLYCRNNQLSSLDVSKNPKIRYLSCYNNNLTSLNLKNGKNTTFNIDFWYYVNFKFNPDLKCILVDNSAYSNTNWSDLKDATASYSDNLDIAPSSITPQTFCIDQNATLSSITITGQNIKWYGDLTNGSLLPNTTVLQNGITYYASQTINGCESERTPVKVFVGDNQPPVPNLTTLPPITGDCTTLITTIPTATDACAGIITATTTSPLSYSLPGTYTIVWVYDDGNGNSMPQNQTVIISSQPLPTGKTNQQFCVDENATLSNLNMVGSNIKWYDASTNGTVLPATTLLENDKTYYATQTLTNCESERVAVFVKIQDTPIPIADPLQSFCVQKNAKISDIVIKGQNINWFKDPSSTLNLSDSTVLENGITYYASQTISNCESDRIPISITILEATTEDCINLVDELPYPKFFTPNNDGYNDYWTIDFAYLKANTGIRIYDRYGKLIKTLTRNSSKWNGTYNGTELPSTDYWFVVTRANGQEYKGHFSLKR
jgi:gliding motility-associated-like protein